MGSKLHCVHGAQPRLVVHYLPHYLQDPKFVPKFPLVIVFLLLLVFIHPHVDEMGRDERWIGGDRSTSLRWFFAPRTQLNNNSTTVRHGHLMCCWISPHLSSPLSISMSLTRFPPLKNSKAFVSNPYPMCFPPLFRGYSTTRSQASTVMHAPHPHDRYSYLNIEAGRNIHRLMGKGTIFVRYVGFT